MLETNYWHKSGKVVIRKVSINSLIKERQKSFAKYGEMHFLCVNISKMQGMLEINYH